MKIEEIAANILSEIRNAINIVNEKEVDKFVNKIFSSKRIFVAGAGRSGILIKAFAMRLMQMGFETYVVGETTTPAIREDDLLVLISGSGETEYSYHILKTARKVGACSYLITARRDSRMGKIACGKIVIPGPTKVSPQKRDENVAQVLGSLFEQAAFILLECILEKIARRINIQHEDILIRHANLE
ncbi:MAG TPA: 6-phospho-3-hexuloisomerase [Candidatus Aerophobetes bacterium]|uniref:6-phospho-3-hexuloisomerase n=1 Tax=Aerophobetes bacterium TaxID=2030807 RepID=A0A7V5M0K1_UNCAE|nr:6-phospho-3-hexuloisomerase [Candidatus Aerophobetes bacterium]